MVNWSISWTIKGKIGTTQGHSSFGANKSSAYARYRVLVRSPETIMEAVLWRDKKAVERFKGWTLNDEIPF